LTIFDTGLVEFEAYFDNKHGVNYTTISYEDYQAPADAYHATTATFFAGVSFIQASNTTSKHVPSLGSADVADRPLDPSPVQHP
jgi:hypothetical protein